MFTQVKLCTNAGCYWHYVINTDPTYDNNRYCACCGEELSIFEQVAQEVKDSETDADGYGVWPGAGDNKSCVDAAGNDDLNATEENGDHKCDPWVWSACETCRAVRDKDDGEAAGIDDGNDGGETVKCYGCGWSDRNDCSVSRGESGGGAAENDTYPTPRDEHDHKCDHGIDADGEHCDDSQCEGCAAYYDIQVIPSTAVPDETIRTDTPTQHGSGWDTAPASTDEDTWTNDTRGIRACHEEPIFNTPVRRSSYRKCYTTFARQPFITPTRTPSPAEEAYEEVTPLARERTWAEQVAIRPAAKNPNTKSNFKNPITPIPTYPLVTIDEPNVRNWNTKLIRTPNPTPRAGSGWYSYSGGSAPVYEIERRNLKDGGRAETPAPERSWGW